MKIQSISKAMPQSRGFALIATISVMVLLVMVALAMLSLSSIEIRASRGNLAQAEARANARMALMIAIGELQQYAGQDQRVTARAEMFDESMDNGSWIGVWNSSKMPNDLSSDIITRNSETGSLEDARSGQSNDIFFKKPLQWLVSGESPVPGESLADPIVLREAVSSTAGRVPEVSVERVPIHGKSGVRSGSYAWFVDDLSMKANIGLDNRKERPDDLPVAGGPKVAPYFAPHGVGNYHDARLEVLKKEDILKLATLGTVGVPTSNKDLQRELAADYTHYSVSLLVDSLNGGLKKDLTAYTKNEPADSSVGLSVWNSYVGISKDDSLLESNPNSDLNLGFHKTYGPKFGLIKSWVNLPVTGASGHYSVDPVAPVMLEGYDLGDAAAKSDLSAFTGNSLLNLPDVKMNTEAAVHPIMALCENEMHLLYEKNGSGNIHSSSLGDVAVDFYKLYYGFFPKVVLWNPYNVTIKAKNYYVQSSYPRLIRLGKINEKITG